MGIERAFRGFDYSSRGIALVAMWGLFILFPLAAERWYLSNAAGIPLREVPALVAQKQEYALRVDWAAPSLLAKELRERYFPQMAQLEKAELFHRGKPILMRYRIYDASLGLLGRVQEDQYNRRFVEVLDVQGRRRIEEWSERKAPEGGAEAQKQEENFYEGLVAYYTYDGSVLVQGDVQDLRGKTLWKDRYRYDRTGALRAVYREYADTGERENISFVSLLGLGNDPIPSSEKGSLGIGMAEREQGVKKSEVNLDSRGRVLEERQLDEKGALVVTVYNRWDSDRLVEQRRVYPDGRESRTSYQYDTEGRLTEERNYQQGVLERRVFYQGEQEVEELYQNGKTILRIVREGGVKVREEWPGRRR
ncbi:hypothetical protein [Treponema sp. J25]|uniref:hypothetical protein n=1 Tax=Treponema sp. J25 TaxID=2094121 RepID=UPI00104A32B0|nr:hypothetical protein [Treponema sp. J25]TCW62233.1 hypothetical protein C5O22_01820 [Treponema sp. J25]